MDSNQNRGILHADFDAFYASVEQRDFPELENKPLAVGGNPRKRGVVASASYEARKFGIKSAMPMSIAVRKCPEVVVVPPRFSVYREVSQQVMELFRNVTPLVEPLSLDEAYLDVTELIHRNVTPPQIAKELKDKIKKLAPEMPETADKNFQAEIKGLQGISKSTPQGLLLFNACLLYTSPSPRDS